jgi:nucleotide-binding universal stress UspA family protein
MCQSAPKFDGDQFSTPNDMRSASAVAGKVWSVAAGVLMHITVTEPLPIDFGGGHAGGWIPSPEEVDRFDAACKERAGKVLNEAQVMAEQIGISTELTHIHVPNAHPASAIIETAKSRGCDLIVIGSHGRRGLRKFFLGSQTSEVLADGSLPVLVVHA